MDDDTGCWGECVRCHRRYGFVSREELRTYLDRTRPMTGKIHITWVDDHREPKNPPDPLYPHGIDLDMSDGQEACAIQLPYPARRCGWFHVKCLLCGTDAIITTAGRPDDPRSVKLRCKLRGTA
jgi:hypothetical protein